VDKELALGDAVSDPVEAHVDDFGAALSYGVVSNARGTGIVGLGGSGWLWMSHLGEGDPEPGTIFGVVEEGAKSGFGCRGDNSFDVGAPLKGGGVKLRSGVAVGSAGRELRKKVPPARERASVSER
jgi:hypothetical protein